MTYIDDQIMQFDLEQALQQISPERRAYALRYRHELGQRLCVAAYQLLQRALLQEYGIQGTLHFTIGEHGKPSLSAYPHIHFNLSHCREAVACAVSDRPIGIDIESMKSEVGDFLIYYILFHIRSIVSHPFKEPDRDTRRST